MPFPRKTCAICGEEFELTPNKPGFANRCPECSMEDEDAGDGGKRNISADERQSQKEMDAERRKAMRDLLYRKDS
jgi:hypothetical protein